MLKKLLVTLISITIILSFIACEDNNTENNDKFGSNSIDKNAPSVNTSIASSSVINEWKVISEFSGSLSDGEKKASSHVFTLSGKEARMKYEIVTSSDSGNALIYIIKEGATKTMDEEGNIDIKIQDALVIGNKSDIKNIRKEAGSYYIEINAFNVQSYKIIIEEKIN